jgi:hypothetical protein
MIPLHPTLQKLDLVTFLNLQARGFYDPIHFWIKHRSPIFCGENQMIQQDSNVMTFIYILAHEPMLCRKLRGNSPLTSIKIPQIHPHRQHVGTPKKRKSRNLKIPAFSNISSRHKNKLYSHILLYPL